MTRRLFFVVVFFCLSISFCRADGGGFPLSDALDGLKTSYSAKLPTPDQRAIIMFDEEKGEERMIVETTFVGQGDQFAWIVPTPANPKIDEVSRNAFTKLEKKFNPIVVRDVWNIFSFIIAFFVYYFYYSWIGESFFSPESKRAKLGLAFGISFLFTVILVVFLNRHQFYNPEVKFNRSFLYYMRQYIGFLIIPHLPLGFLLYLFQIGKLHEKIMLFSSESVRRIWSHIEAIGFLSLFFPILYFPLYVVELTNMSFSEGSHGGSLLSHDRYNGAITVYQKTQVGAFDVAVVSSSETVENSNPDALLLWFKDNGFAYGPEDAKVFGQYVKEGWFFSAIKVHRENGQGEKISPHPLAFTFNTARAVYPLRLTGVNNGPCLIDLYVFGKDRAELDGFKVKRCEKRIDGWGSDSNTDILKGIIKHTSQRIVFDASYGKASEELKNLYRYTSDHALNNFIPPSGVQYYIIGKDSLPAGINLPPERIARLPKGTIVVPESEFPKFYPYKPYPSEPMTWYSGYHSNNYFNFVPNPAFPKEMEEKIRNFEKQTRDMGKKRLENVKNDYLFNDWSCVTKLSGKLSESQMKKDGYFFWRKLRETKEYVFSYFAAGMIGLNVFSVLGFLWFIAHRFSIGITESMKSAGAYFICGLTIMVLLAGGTYYYLINGIFVW